MASNPQLTSNPFLFVNEIQDVYLRKNFQVLRDYFNSQNQLLGFKFAELVFTAPTSNFLFPHSLNFIPLDIVVSHMVGVGKVSFKYDLFDSTNMVLDVDGPCRIRFFYGTYWNFTSNINTNPGDKTVVASGA